MFRTFRLPLLLALCLHGTWLRAQEAADVKMTTKVFRLPFHLMGPGTSVSPKPVPADPFAADPFAAASSWQRPAQELPDFKSSRQMLEEVGVVFPTGASALFDPVTQELTVHNTEEALDLTQAFIDGIQWEGSTPTLAFTLTLVEGPGEVIRQANAAASRQVDAAPQLEALLAEAATPGSPVQVVGEMFLEAKSGTRATAEAVLERPVMDGYAGTTTAATTAATTPAPVAAADDRPVEVRPSWTREDGMKLELDFTSGQEGKTLMGALSLHLGPEPPELDSGGGRLPAPGGRQAEFQTAIHMPNGSTKVIGITQPTGKERAEGKDILQAAFLTGHVRRLKTPPGVAAVTDDAQAKLPAGMRAVAFEMPDGLAEIFIPKELLTAQGERAKNAVLASHGPMFPAGVSLEHRDGRMRIVNTPESIEAVAALVDYAWGRAPHSVALTLHTFRVPVALLRPLVRQGTATEEADDSAMLAAVEAAAARGEARVVRSAFLEGKSGVRSRHECGLEHSVLTNFDTTPARTDRELGFMQQIVGDVLEIEPTVGASGRTVELDYTHELHPAPPAERREALRVTLATKDHDVPGVELQVLRTKAHTAMASGTVKLLSLHRIHAAADPFEPEMLWATFLQAHVLPQTRKMQPPPPTKEEAARARITEKMHKIIMPEVKLQEATLEQAVEYLRVKSREMDTTTDVESEKGVNLILPPDDFPTGDTSITLELKDVPFDEALRYVSELAQKRYIVRAHGVLVANLHYGMEERMHTRIFRVPPDFLSISDADTETTAPDPFAPAPDANANAKAGGPKPQKTARSVLEAQGIIFSEGASAHFTPTTGMLVVRNTKPNLDLVEAFTECTLGKGTHPSLAFTVQVLQGPGPLLRRIAGRAAPLTDHRALLEELLAAVKAGTVRALDTARIETQGGTRASARQGCDDALLSGLVLDGQGGALPLYEPLFHGLRLELEPSLSVDGACVGLTLDSEFHTAPLLPRQEHLVDDQGRRIDFTLTDARRTRLTTALNIVDGGTRLLHLWKPTGRPEFEKDDVLQVMFITCDILRSAEE